MKKCCLPVAWQKTFGTQIGTDNLDLKNTPDGGYIIATSTSANDAAFTGYHARSTVTGLTDIDFPNQLINIYPNPFANIINVSGLNTGKSYTINISNTSGQKVYSQQVANSSTLSINKSNLKSGRYWLNIYDYKKHKLIGTVAVIKE